MFGGRAFWIVFFAATLVAQASQARVPAPDCNPQMEAASVQQTGAFTADHPVLMAIGDSLYNGVESLSLTKEKSAFSVPELVSKALNNEQPLTQPSYNNSMLIDLDRQLLQPWLTIVSNTGKTLVRNIAAFADPNNPQFPKQSSSSPFFDNIAVAQADSVGLICDTAGDANAFITTDFPLSGGGSIPPNQIGPLGIPLDIGQWFYDLNSRFILNPTLDHRYDRLSQLAEVLLRKPKTLLINIGSNDSVWLMAFNGFAPDTCFIPTDPDDPAADCNVAGTTNIRHESGDLVSNMGAIARYLSQDSQDTTTVIVNLLPRPSAAGNLKNIGSQRYAADPYYFATYQNYFGTSGVRTIPGKDVKAMDDLVADTNTAIVNSMCAAFGTRPGSRIVFVDLARLLMRYDHKQNGEAKVIKIRLFVDGKWREASLNNDILGISKLPDWNGFHIVDGGLFSYDNMHPTAFGYALVANAVLNAIAAGSNCARVEDDTPQIPYQSVSDQLHSSGTTTAVDVDWGAHNFLDIAHHLLSQESASSVVATINAQAKRDHVADHHLSADVAAKIAPTMHGFLALGAYPPQHWKRHRKEPQP